MDLSEIKSLLEQQGRDFEEFKKTNDALIKEKAEGKAVGDLEAKLDKINKALDEKSDRLLVLGDEIKDLKINGTGGGGDGGEAAAELKQFNVLLQAHFQAKGKTWPGPVAADGYAQYKAAVDSMLRHGNADLLSADERKAMIAGSDPDGGFVLPSPTVGRIVKKVYERSVLRQLSTVVSISTNDIEGLIDNGEASAGWVGEVAARPETNTPQIGKWRIEAHEMYAAPRITQKLLDDAAINIEAWLADKVGDKFARIESDAFVNGNGVGKPRGLFTYPTAATSDDSRAWGTFEHINTGASGDFHSTKADPLQDMLGAFRNEYLPGASWLMRREVRTKIRKMKEATSDRYLWEPSLQAGQPDRLLGYPVYVDQFLPSLGSNSLSAAFGDFREAFLIVDRIGVRTLRDQYTAKPYVIFYSTRRVGSGAVNFEAVKFLRFGT